MPGSIANRPANISLVAGAFVLGLVLVRADFAVSLEHVLLCIFGVIIAKGSRWWWLAFAVLALCLGLARGQIYQGQKQLLLDQMGYEVVISGTVADDPSINDRRQSEFRISQLVIDGERVTGVVRVRLYPVRLKRGHQVSIQGVLKPGFATWDAAMYYPKLQILSTDQTWLEKIRQNFVAGMRTALPEPISSFGLGLLVGVRALIPKYLQEDLTRVGLSHMVAVSGYNLTVIVSAVFRLIGRFGKGIALVLGIWLIGAFVLLSGASASIVRAGLVALVVLLAQRYGRKLNPLVLVLTGAALTAGWNPDYLIDLGWLLSFLAFFGILVLSPAIERRMGGLKYTISGVLLQTLCAEILTLPLILFIFGELSVISPVANVVIVPFVPIAMLMSFIAGLAGLLLPAWCGFLAWPAELVLYFMLDLISSLAALPWAATSYSFNRETMVGCYLVIAAATAVLYLVNSRLPELSHERDVTRSRLL